jgi:hypothetical protein
MEPQNLALVFKHAFRNRISINSLNEMAYRASQSFTILNLPPSLSRKNELLGAKGVERI